jgi:two-component system nitrate/nitrite response regulator NarL
MPISFTGQRRNMDKHAAKFSVSLCETQPITVKGFRQLLDETEDLALLASHVSPTEWMMSGAAEQTDVLVIDKGLGAHLVLEGLNRLPVARNGQTQRPGVVIWGMSISEAEALKFLQCGARGIVRKSADLDSLLACLRAVAAGRSWMQDSVFREAVPQDSPMRTDPTSREQQVMELVEQGYKNREIAQELGIRPGTVKIHLKHIFEKTGVHGRHGLALTGLRQKGVITLLSA